jgi:hypothetical protein
VEDCILVGEKAQPLKARKQLEFEDNPKPQEAARIRSPGEMMEASEADAGNAALPSGKMNKISVNQYIAYCAGDPRQKKCRIGRVTLVSKPDGSVTVHRHRPVTDGRLRISWLPVFMKDGEEVTAEGSLAAKETVTPKQILTVVEMLEGGVIGHAATRKVDKANWRFDESDVQIMLLCKAPSNLPAIKLQEWYANAAGYLPEECVNFVSDEIQQYLTGTPVDFLEIFMGEGAITIGCNNIGLRSAEGIDRSKMAYGRAWNIQSATEVAAVFWIISKGLKPRAIHSGTPCTELGTLGNGLSSIECEICVQLTIDVSEHQRITGGLASAENPKNSRLFLKDSWASAFGTE